MLSRTISTTLAIPLALGLAAAPSSARELSFAIGHPPVSYLVQGGEKAAEAFGAATGGEMTMKVYPLSLLSMAETPGGLREGLADVGTVMTTYFPNAFPHTNLIVESSMLLETLGAEATAVQGTAFTAAVTEFIFTKCPECNEEFAAENQVFTGGVGTPALRAELHPARGLAGGPFRRPPAHRRRQLVSLVRGDRRGSDHDVGQ